MTAQSFTPAGWAAHLKKYAADTKRVNPMNVSSNGSKSSKKGKS